MKNRLSLIRYTTVVLWAVAVSAQTVPPHTPHHPNISNMLSTYGLDNEPASLVPGIKQWLADRFDRVVTGSSAGPKNGKAYWLDYVDVAYVYARDLYAVQRIADANSFVLENMLLHSSIDMKYSTSSVAKWWKDMHQFDAFEKSGGVSIRGVFTYNGAAYTDVTTSSYDNAHQITLANTLFVGYMEPFDQMNFTISRARVGGSVGYFYWNGAAWTPLTPRSDTSSGLTATGQIYFYPPADWTRTAVNGSMSKYWVRIVVTNAITAPIYSRLYGDDWNVASAANNARGWDATVPACPANTPNGTSCRINPGTRLEYDANPPANSAARFRYQARTTGLWAATATFGNPSDVQNGVLTWAKYLADVATAQVLAKGTEGIMFDDGNACPAPASPSNPNPYFDIDHSKTCAEHRLVVYGQVRDALHATFGPNFQVGTNTMSAALGRLGDWAYAESYAYTSYGLGGRYTVTDDESRYDWWLPVSNPRGTKTAILCWDTPSALTSGVGRATSWHFWDRGNRSPIGCLAQHYLGSNENTAFAYYTEGGFIYNDTDEVYTYASATTILTPVAADTTSQSKTIQLANASGCSTLLRLGSRDNGDTISGTLTGTTFTTTSAIYHAYSAGDPAYCIQKQHQSLVSPPVENVWKWSTWFPARSVDIGAPDTAGLNSGARLIPWKKGGSPDYVSGQTRATCAAAVCSDVWRRDFTKAIVLLRPMSYNGLEAEYDTPSQPIELGGTFYPLRADGTTGPGVTSIRLRGAEAAVLMKRPIASAQSRPPICNAGQQAAVRAGQDVQLDGSGSSSLNGDAALRYLWQQLSGPTTARWSSRSVARPSVSGLIFGSYVFQLTVTDSSNQSSSCTVKRGAVATDANSVVISNNPAASSLLGPMIRAGANPWPWFDDRHKAAADLQMAAMDAVYPPWWDSPAPGTVTVAPGSQAVTGAGTSFTSTFCQGPANPNTPKDDAVIAVWYRTGNGVQTGRRMAKVTACLDDAHLTIDDPWASAVIPAGTGLGYSADDASTHYAADWGWADAASTGNAGDNVAAYYALYYRTGVDDYLAAARKLADRVWRSPMIDRGASQIAGQGGRYGYAGRSLGVVGLLLRALELQGTDEDMWPGMRHIWDSYMDRLMGIDKSRAPGMWHTEEQAHHLAIVSYCALFDPDPAYQANCKAAVSNSFANVWTPSRSLHGYWAQLFYAKSSWDTASSASLVNGSTAVVGNAAGWTEADFPATIWFTNDPAARPASNQAGDSQVYTVTFVNSGLLTLDRPYEGTAGSHGWALTPGQAMLGWGAQPSAMGTLAFAFGLAAQAIAGTYPNEAALAGEYTAVAADWIRTYGYWPAQKGLYAYAQGINCQAPISAANPACTGNTSVAEVRARSSRALKGLMPAYAARYDGILRDFADTLFNAMFARPDSCPSGSSTLCIPDGVYLDGLDAGGSMMTDLPPDGSHWFGEFFGFNNLSAWPASRMGRIPTANRRAKYVAFNLGQVRGAVGVRVTATEPNGEQTSVECSASPCPVSVDIRQGRALIEMQYLSGTGKPLATTAFPL